MPFFEAVRLALESIRTQKLKSFFSMVGVLIGVTFLIAVVSVVQGMNVYVTDQISDALGGVNTFQMTRTPHFSNGNVTEEMWLSWQRRPQITIDDAAMLGDRMRIPARIARFSRAGTDIVWRGRTAKQIEVDAVDAEFFRIKHWNIESGRLFTPQEVAIGAAVVVLGNELANRLFESRDPLGQMIKVGGLPHRIIGVIEAQGSIFGISQDKFVVTPFTSPARRLVNRPRVLDEVYVQVEDPSQMRDAMDEVTMLMRSVHGLKPSQPDDFHLETAEGALAGWDSIMAVLFLALPLLVSISLVVGGIVIMNIMLMAVTERTSEIGVRKALGAKRSDIMSQFVVESAVLSVTGAVLGIGTGLAMAFALKAWTPLPAAVAPWSIYLAVGLGIFVGMVAGVYPARQASRLDPIAALRQE